MDGIRDSIRATCSSPLRPSTALSFKTRPTCHINEDDGPADTATLHDRAARKEMERVRLRKLLNQGKKKRRRLNADKLPTNGASLGPVDDFHCQRGGPHVPRKSRSVGYRRRSKSWKLIGLRLFSEQIELPIPSAPTKDEKLSHLSGQNEIEIEFEIAEVLSGLKKKVSSSDELLTDDLEKNPVEDESKIKLEKSTCYLGSSQLCASLPESIESKQPTKFTFDLNEPPPLESSLEDDKMEHLTTYSENEMKSVPDDAIVTRFVLPWKLEVNGEGQDLDWINNGSKQPFQKQQEGYTYTSNETGLLARERISPTREISFSGNLNSIQHGKQGFEFYSHHSNQENNPRQSGRTMAGPRIFPQNLTRTTAMPNHPSSPASNRNVRISYPSRSPFLSVLPRNICTNDGQNGERKNHLLPVLDRQLHPSQMCLPIEMQQQDHLSHSTQATPTNVFLQTPYPLNFSMPHNHVAVPGFSDKEKLGSQIVAADSGLQYRHSEMVIRRINQAADSTLPVGDSTSWIRQSGFVLKSCSPVPNCKLSFSKQKAMAASQLMRVSTVNKQHQQPTTAEVSNGFIYDRSPALQNPQLKLTNTNSHIQL